MALSFQHSATICPNAIYELGIERSNERRGTRSRYKERDFGGFSCFGNATNLAAFELRLGFSEPPALMVLPNLCEYNNGRFGEPLVPGPDRTCPEPRVPVALLCCQDHPSVCLSCWCLMIFPRLPCKVEVADTGVVVANLNGITELFGDDFAHFLIFS